MYKPLALALFFFWLGLCFLGGDVFNIITAAVAGWQIGVWCGKIWNME